MSGNTTVVLIIGILAAVILAEKLIDAWRLVKTVHADDKPAESTENPPAGV